MTSDQRHEPGPTFRIARRGYDREQVEARIAELTSRVGALEGERDRLVAQLSSLGVEGSAGLRSELENVAAEVGQILEAAQDAAEAMRTRAADDAARWRQAAEAEAFEARQRAEADAVALRGDAWRTGTAMLQQARQESERIRAAAEQDAILTRAEGEQEAHRLTGSARKEIADEARLSRLKAERMQEEARISSEATLAEARREAEAAQERVRALEHRRTELMREIDAARAALTALQSEIEAQAAAPEPEPEPEPVPEPAPDAPPDEAKPAWAPGWPGDEGTVRIVSRTVPVGDEVVDAEAMAAEVQAMRARREAAIAPAPVLVDEPEPGAELPPVAPGVPDAGAAEVEERAGEEPEVPEPELEVPAAVVEEPVVEEVPEPEPEVPAAVVEEPVVEEVPEPEPEVPAAEEGAASAAVAPSGPAIDDLFSRLRGGGTVAPNGQPAVAPVPDPGPATEPEPEPEPARPPLRAVPAALGIDPFDLRDRLLLPLTNSALRTAKRAIVDLQNIALEELRTSGGEWDPDGGAYAAQLGPTLATLAAESRSAGVRAAAELTGEPAPADVGAGPDQPGPDVVDDLVTGVRDVLRRALETDAGPRQRSAAVSRFFRVWRTDEAERHLRQVALAGYHGGLIAACAALGISAVEGVANGTTCAACPASTGERWAPGDPPPDGTTSPPAHADCMCTVLPCSDSPVGGV